MTAPDSLVQSVRYALDALGSARPSQGFLVHALGAAPTYHVGYDDTGRIVLIAPPEQTGWPPLRLERLAFLPTVRSQLSLPGGRVEVRDVAVVLVDVSDGQFADVLPSLISGVVATAGATPGPGDLGRAVRALRDVFQALSRDATRSYLGVWGELFLIRYGTGPRLLAAAWGADPTQSFDFAVEGERLEVKTTLQAVRRHHFSYSQLMAARVTEVAVASIQTAQAPDGISAGELVEDILVILENQPDLAEGVIRRASAALGTQLFDPLCARYDRQLAETSLALYAFNEIPTVDLEPGVVDVSWMAELSAQPRTAVTGSLARAARLSAR